MDPRLYPPLEIEQPYTVPTDKHPGLEEDAQVKFRILHHGIDHVRGGIVFEYPFNVDADGNAGKDDSTRRVGMFSMQTTESFCQSM
jgi:hypothetical protein